MAGQVSNRKPVSGNTGTKGSSTPQASPKKSGTAGSSAYSPVSSFTKSEKKDFSQLLGEIKQSDPQGIQREVDQLLKAGVPVDQIISALTAKGISPQTALSSVLQAIQANGGQCTSPSGGGGAGASTGQSAPNQTGDQQQALQQLLSDLGQNDSQAVQRDIAQLLAQGMAPDQLACALMNAGLPPTTACQVVLGALQSQGASPGAGA